MHAAHFAVVLAPQRPEVLRLAGVVTPNALLPELLGAALALALSALGVPAFYKPGQVGLYALGRFYVQVSSSHYLY